MLRLVTLLLGVNLALGCETTTELEPGDGQIVRLDNGHCVRLLPENSLHPVRACETIEAYEFTVVDRQWSLSKKDFQTALRDRILQYVRPTVYRWKTLQAAQVEIWITAPIFAPQQASIVALVLSTGGNFSVSLPMDVDLWSIESSQVSFLGDQRYPSIAAKRMGLLVLQPQGHVTQDRLARFIDDTGVLERRDLMPMARKDNSGNAASSLVRASWQPLQLQTHPFAEVAVAQVIMRHEQAPSIVQSIELLPASEREGAKALAFTFSFAGD